MLKNKSSLSFTDRELFYKIFYRSINQMEFGYLTSGMSEKIKLKKGKWYTVEGAGNITLSPVNVRVE